VTIAIASIIIGLLLVGVALTGSVVRRLPLSAAMLYTLVGIILGPAVLGIVDLDPFHDAWLLERVTQIAILISLFTAGLKLRVPLRDPRWRLSLRLAFVSMTITVALVAVAGVYGLGLSLGAAILLGGIIAPTDPVLASDVQVRHPGDRERLRFSLTSEAGLNDGTAFPLVVLGLGMLGLHDIGDFGVTWLAVDVLWGISVGLATGAILGTLIGHLVLYLRREHKEAVGLDDFLALGLIALAFGCASVIGALGFLSVFAAGLAVRRIEAQAADAIAPPDVRKVAEARIGEDERATHPATAHAHMTEAVLGFNEQIDRIGAMAVMVLVGAMLARIDPSLDALWFVPLLLLVIRPIAVWAGLARSQTSTSQRLLIGWFGVRGVGSVFYLAYATEQGLSVTHAETIATLTLCTVAASVVVHGVSVTPLMTWYEQRAQRRQTRPGRLRALIRRSHAAST
jgi:NhaP-type Na+/H+ or K+/H+ antiporter